MPIHTGSSFFPKVQLSAILVGSNYVISTTQMTEKSNSNLSIRLMNNKLWNSTTRCSPCTETDPRPLVASDPRNNSNFQQTDPIF